MNHWKCFQSFPLKILIFRSFLPFAKLFIALSFSKLRAFKSNLVLAFSLSAVLYFLFVIFISEISLCPNCFIRKALKCCCLTGFWQHTKQEDKIWCNKKNCVPLQQLQQGFFFVFKFQSDSGENLHQVLSRFHWVKTWSEICWK